MAARWLKKMSLVIPDAANGLVGTVAVGTNPQSTEWLEGRSKHPRLVEVHPAAAGWRNAANLYKGCQESLYLRLLPAESSKTGRPPPWQTATRTCTQRKRSCWQLNLLCVRQTLGVLNGTQRSRTDPLEADGVYCNSTQKSKAQKLFIKGSLTRNFRSTGTK